MSDRTDKLEAWAASDAFKPKADDPGVLRGDAAREFGRDLLERAGRGRPALEPMAKGETSPRRQVRLPGGLSDLVDQLAADQGRTPSDLMREAIATYVDTHRAAS